MSRRYKNLLPLLVHTEDASYKQGEEFDKDFTPEQEQENVESGLLEVVPRTYKVVGTSEVDGHAPGDTFESSMLMVREALLVEGGHIAPVEAKKTTKKTKEES